MKMYSLALMGSLALLAGCTTAIKPTTPQQAVYAAVALDYQTALDVAITYDSLPPCEAVVHPPLCSTTAAVKAIKDAKDKASPLVKAAEAAVRDPNMGQNAVQSAVVIAQQAVNALTAILATLPHKGATP